MRALLFSLFFAVGLAAVVAAMLADEIEGRYLLSGELEQVRRTNEELRLAADDYDAVISRLENDPNLVRRLARVTLGMGDGEVDEQTAYPKGGALHRRIAEQIVERRLDSGPHLPDAPGWVRRINEPWRRGALFAAGAGLIIVSFVCFRRRVGEEADVSDGQ